MSITISLLALGNRGKHTYGNILNRDFKDKVKIVAIADIDKQKVEGARKDYNVDPSMCFNSAEEMLKREKLSDAIVITSQDRQHYKHIIAAMKKGYHVLLEKPISPNYEECNDIVRVAKETGRKVVVCHVLRYTPFYKKIKEILDSKILGDIISTMAIENVGYYHQAHSFVRGNWRNSEETSPMILQKCCHDMDILSWLVGKRAKSISSFGSLNVFKEEAAPKGSSLRCLDGKCKIKEECPYDAQKIYIESEKTGIKYTTGWPIDVVTFEPNIENVTQALKTGPYGRCVYHCDNNVVDHQITNILMEDDTTISLTMCAFTSEISRYVKFMGSLGDMIADMKANTIEVRVFNKESVLIDVNKLSNDFSGHGGGDKQLVKEFIQYIEEDKYGNGLSSIEASVDSHYMAFAAEKSRLNNGNTVNLEDYRKGDIK